MSFFAALKFLTIIPLPWRREFSLDESGRSTGYFPVVGIIIGLILVALHWLLGLLLPPPVVNVLLIVCLVMITGALHLDGFIDTCDGIGGRGTAEARRQVMRDSRTGSFGVVGACLLLLVKYVSLNSVPDTLLRTTMVLMPVVSRWAMVYAIFAYPYARPSGIGRMFKEETNWWRLVIATIITLVVAAVLAWPAGLAVVLGIWVTVIAMAAYLRQKFSGLTGDAYGAVNEVAEVCVLILVCMLARLGLA